MVWNDDSTTPKYATKSPGGSWSSQKNFRTATGKAFWIDIASNPVVNSNKIAMAIADDRGMVVGGDVSFAEWSGNGNGDGSLVIKADIGSTHRRASVLVAYEATSGRAVVVWGKSSDDPRYSVWNGSRFTTSDVKIPNFIGGSSGMMRSQPGTNNILLGVLD